MKRRELERHLRAHGCRLIDEGASHTRWAADRRTDGGAATPRDDYGLARMICAQLSVPPPTGSR